jgi:hypothetical protein
VLNNADCCPCGDKLRTVLPLVAGIIDGVVRMGYPAERVDSTRPASPDTSPREGRPRRRGMCPPTVPSGAPLFSVSHPGASSSPYSDGKVANRD